MRVAPAALALALLLVVGGCGGSFSSSFEAGESTKLSVIAWKGRLRLRNGTAGRIDVAVRGRSDVPLDRVVAFVRTSKSDGGSDLALEVDKAAKDADLDLEIAAPPGISLSCRCAEADVDVSGAWADLVVTTDGAIVTHADAKGGRLTGRRGGVSFVAAGAGPTGELRAESTSGHVRVALPAAWSGQLKFQTQTGKLDVPEHGNLQTIWDENQKGAVGRMGPPREKGAPLPTVWAISGTGDVSFRVGE